MPAEEAFPIGKRFSAVGPNILDPCCSGRLSALQAITAFVEAACAGALSAGEARDAKDDANDYDSGLSHLSARNRRNFGDAPKGFPRWLPMTNTHDKSPEQLASHYLALAEQALARARSATTPEIRDQYILLSDGWFALATATGTLTPDVSKPP